MLLRSYAPQKPQLQNIPEPGSPIVNQGSSAAVRQSEALSFRVGRIHKITGSDGTTSYRMIQITEAKGNASGETSFAVPTGAAEGTTYEITEMRNARYLYESASSGSALVSKIDSNLFRFAPVKGNRSAEINYQNSIRKWNKITHETSVINKIPRGS